MANVRWSTFLSTVRMVMVLVVKVHIQSALITLTQTTARDCWLWWHQEDQTVPRNPPRCRRKIPRIASFEENSDQRAKILDLDNHFFRNLKPAVGKINVRCVKFGCLTRTHCRYFWFFRRGGSTPWPKWEVLVTDILAGCKSEFKSSKRGFRCLDRLLKKNDIFWRCAFVCVFVVCLSLVLGGCWCPEHKTDVCCWLC